MTISLRYTVRDLEGMPDIDGVRYEIIDGDLYVSKSPDWHHQYTAGRVFLALQLWSDQTEAGIAIEAPGVIFAEDDAVAPDIVWISRARQPHLLGGPHLRAAPDLIVEVLSPGATNERRDRDLKLRLYSRQGVHEYWIVDWQLHTVQVYRRQRAALRLTATLDGKDVLTSPMLPGFASPLPTLWSPASTS